MVLDMPAGFLEDVGEQRFGSLASFNGGRFQWFFRILHNFDAVAISG
jgi:hypothetical protein